MRPLLLALLLAACTPTPRGPVRFRIAVVADTHVIDGFYDGQESNPLDTSSLQHTADRLRQVREVVNGIQPAVDFVAVLGDVFHNYPSDRYEFFQENRTRLDEAAEILRGFRAPVHIAWGNHDYAVPEVSRETSHRLFAEKFGAPPYHAFVHKGVRFVFLNMMLGRTWDPADPRYDQGMGSLGAEQLAWLDAQLSLPEPVMLFSHHSLLVVEEDEEPGSAHPDLFALVGRHREKILGLLSGHTHVWLDFGGEFGIPHYVIAASRYDEDSFTVLEIDPEQADWAFTDADKFHWTKLWSEPFDYSTLPPLE